MDMEIEARARGFGSRRLFVPQSLISAVLVFLCLGGSLQAAEPASLELSLVVEHSVDTNEACEDTMAKVGQGRHRHDLIVTLRNGTKAVLVAPTRGAQLILERTELPNNEITNYRIKCLWEFPQNPADPQVSVDADQLKVVTLQPGDKTQLRIVLLASRVIAPERMAFEYFVGRDIGVRFGTWSGALRSDAAGR